MKFYSKFLDVCEKIARTLAVLMMVFILALSLYQILGRFVFQSQVWWAEQICRYVFIWMMMIYIPVICRHNQNLGFDMLLKHFPQKVQDISWLVCELLIAAFGGFWCYYTIQLSMKFYKIDKIYEGLNWHCWWLYLCQALAGAFIVIYSVEVVYNQIKKISHENMGGEEK